MSISVPDRWCRRVLYTVVLLIVVVLVSIFCLDAIITNLFTIETQDILRSF